MDKTIWEKGLILLELLESRKDIPFDDDTYIKYNESWDMYQIFHKKESCVEKTKCKAFKYWEQIDWYYRHYFSKFAKGENNDD